MFSLNNPPRFLFSINGRVSKSPPPDDEPPLPPRLLKAPEINRPTSPDRKPDRPEKNPSNELPEPELLDGRFVDVRDELPPKLKPLSSP